MIDKEVRKLGTIVSVVIIFIIELLVPKYMTIVITILKFIIPDSLPYIDEIASVVVMINKLTRH